LGAHADFDRTGNKKAMLGLVKLIIRVCLVFSKNFQQPPQRKFHGYGRAA
jgi:hypothetical protein